MNQDTARAVARSFQDSRHSSVHIISLHVVLSFKMKWKCCVIMSQISARLPCNGCRYHWFNFWHRRIVWRNFWNTRWQTVTDRRSKIAQRQQIWWKNQAFQNRNPDAFIQAWAILIFSAFYNLRLDLLQPWRLCFVLGLTPSRILEWDP